MDYDNWPSLKVALRTLSIEISLGTHDESALVISDVNIYVFAYSVTVLCQPDEIENI
jgi:hypothetical protein